MPKIKKGSIVGRKSYGKDILFEVEKIVKNGAKESIAILKGITIRIEADSNLEDLEIMDQSRIENNLRTLDSKLESRIQNRRGNLELKDKFIQKRDFLREKKRIWRVWNDFTFRWG